MGSGLNGMVPILIKLVIPLAFAYVFITLVSNIIKLGESKLIYMNEAYHISPPRYELFKPFIMVYFYLSLCFLIPLLVMPYVSGILITGLIIILRLYSKTWKFFGFSIVSYLLVILAVLIASIITAAILQSLLIHIIIPYVGRVYNSVV